MGSSKKDEKLDCPIIIVIKGNYSTKKSQIANKIASFLQYPLTDEGDIILSLQNSISNLSSSKYYNKDLVFQIVRQISSTQIKLKLNIVVNTELSQYSHFEDLAQLAASEEASLLIIGCDAEQNGGHLYDIGNVPKLNVDPSKPFIAEEFVPAMLQSLQGNALIEQPKNNIKNNLIGSIRAQAHAHEFSLIAEPNTNSGLGSSCNGCKQVVKSDPAYKCVSCDDFIFHKSCAELPTQKIWYLKRNCPTFLADNPPKYDDFPNKQKCKLCEEFSYNCNDCLLQMHIDSRFLPTVLNHEIHSHSLNFVIMPLWFNYKYLCSSCNKFGECMSYKCYRCNFDLHINCVLTYFNPKIEMITTILPDY